MNTRQIGSGVIYNERERQRLLGDPSVNDDGHQSSHHKSLPYGMSNMYESTQMLTKSYSIHADGEVSYLTPLELGRHQLYAMSPFTALFGMQQKERSITKCYAEFAADLDNLSADNIYHSETNKHLSTTELASRKSQASLMLMEELDLDNQLYTPPLLVAIFVAGCSQFLVGYNLSVLNAPESVIFKEHSTFEWSLAVAIFAIGAPIGCAIAGNLLDTRGRRHGLVFVTYTFMIGGLLQTFAWNMSVIIVSRFVIGVASGFSSVVVPCYLGELAPPTLRGTLGTVTQFCLVIGIFVSNLLAFPFANNESWRVLLAVTVFVALIQTLCFPWLIESPKWLLSRDKTSRRARHILKRLRGIRYDHEVDIEVDHFISATKLQQVGSDHTSSAITLVTMLMDTHVRRLLICSLVLQVAQQLSGINAVFYYSTSFFQGIIANPMLGTCIISGINVLATYVALLLMETTNRRTLLNWSAWGMLGSSIALVFCLLGYFSKICSVLFVISYVSFFEIGLGPVPWLIVAEMFEPRYVTTAMSVSSQVNWASNFVVGMAFPYLQSSLGALSFAPFIVVLASTIVFVAIYLPETRGLSPEDLREEVSRNLSAILALPNDSGGTDHSSSVGNPIDVEWRRAMDDLRRQEEEDMMRGTFNYGFQPIEKVEEAPITPFVPDWQSRESGKPTGSKM
mmetsp:Transcript_19504/g.44015  ORF Transcript_19504/g.44015 Transcript_19504/m.44015 type:complete len:680 (+) Transcript_19504:93-2132(+)